MCSVGGAFWSRLRNANAAGTIFGLTLSSGVAASRIFSRLDVSGSSTGAGRARIPWAIRSIDSGMLRLPLVLFEQCASRLVLDSQIARGPARPALLNEPVAQDVRSEFRMCLMRAD